MLDIGSIIKSQMTIVQGRIVGFGEEGDMLVMPVNEEIPVQAYLLRITREAAPRFISGDKVLMALVGEIGYVFGKMEPSFPRGVEMSCNNGYARMDRKRAAYPAS